MAAQVILKYEWLGTMAGTGRHYGIFFGPWCAGVTCVAVGGGTGGVNSHKPFGIARHELGVLARGACVHWAPPGANSKLVGWTCRLLRDTDCRLLLAYSDSDAGEIGTIYQACNWTYIGKGAATLQWVSPAGRIMDQKLPYDMKRRYGGTRRDFARRLRAEGWTEQLSNPKGRYVYVIDKADRTLADRVEGMRQAYPKRASEPTSVGTGVQPGEGGATPTRTLSEGGE